jgi:drug/metabolite transporter (DMT)-like permease
MQQRIWLAALAASAGWGTGTVMSRVALEGGATPYEVAMLRGLLAGVAVVALMAVRRSLRRPSPIAVRVGTVMAFTNMAIPFLMGALALQYASAGFVALPVSLVPLATAALAHIFLPDERLSVVKVVGLGISLAGVAVLLLSGDSGLAEGGNPLLAGMLGLVSVVSIASGSIYSKRRAGEYGLLQVSSVQFLLGAAALAVTSLVVEGRAGAGPADVWPVFVYLGLVSTVTPFLLYYWLIRRVTATYAAAVGYVIPLIAVVVGVIFLDEQIQPGIAFGGALILSGVILTDWLERRRAAPILR